MRKSLAIFFVVLAEAALAQDVSEQLKIALSDQGYEIVEVRKTWLGRILVISVNSETGAIREMVLEKGSGQVLNDSVFDTGPSFGGSSTKKNQPSGTSKPSPSNSKPDPSPGGGGAGKGGGKSKP